MKVGEKFNNYFLNEEDLPKTKNKTKNKTSNIFAT